MVMADHLDLKEFHGVGDGEGRGECQTLMIKPTNVITTKHTQRETVVSANI